MADLNTDLGKIQLKNPVMTASGTFGYGKEYNEFFPISDLGAVVVKGIAPFESHGNSTPRIAEVTSGMLNAIGLQGPGVNKFINGDDYLPFLRLSGADVIVNIWGRTVDEYAETASRLSDFAKDLTGLEINISCPNVKEGGASFGTDIKSAVEVVKAVRDSTDLPLITKLSPNFTAVGKFAEAVVDAGSDMISLINTLPAMAIDIKTRKPKIANVFGGLSGPAIKPVALKMVYEVSKAVDVPVIGMGGIFSYEDALEFFIAGASAVAVGTAIFSNPYAPVHIIKGIEKFLDENGIEKISDIVGSIKL
jgi:dihydroorotate dehydrogenase (NAD+) catalytic subunit